MTPTPQAPQIMLVDDDPDIRLLVKQFLAQHGFRVSEAADGEAMRRVFAAEAVDLIVLDLMLPGEDGLSLCRQLRTASAVPVIFLTAIDSEADRVVGLELGGDDYLTKPFSTRELLARIRAVLRRTTNSQTTRQQTTGSAIAGEPRPRAVTLVFSGWRLDAGKRQLRSPDGILVPLSGGEYELLNVFLKNPHTVLNRDQLLDLTRGRIAGPFDRTIDVQVGRLRRKIETDPKNPELIKTLRGGGYVLSADVDIA